MRRNDIILKLSVTDARHKFSFLRISSRTLGSDVGLIWSPHDQIQFSMFFYEEEWNNLEIQCLNSETQVSHFGGFLLEPWEVLLGVFGAHFTTFNLVIFVKIKFQYLEMYCLACKTRKCEPYISFCKHQEVLVVY